MLPEYTSSMRVAVKLFAVLRERAGTGDLSLDVPVGTTISTAVELLFDRLPEIRQTARGAAYAVNRSYAGRETVLMDGDELALLPPVSGG